MAEPSRKLRCRLSFGLSVCQAFGTKKFTDAPVIRLPDFCDQLIRWRTRVSRPLAAAAVAAQTASNAMARAIFLTPLQRAETGRSYAGLEFRGPGREEFLGSFRSNETPGPAADLEGDEPDGPRAGGHRAVVGGDRDHRLEVRPPPPDP